MDLADPSVASGTSQDLFSQLVEYLKIYFMARDAFGSLQTFAAVIAGVSLWDYAVTFFDEIEYIWKAEWTFLNLCLLVTRYWTIITIALYTGFLHWSGSAETCARHVKIIPGAALLVTLFGNSIMTARLFAITNKNVFVLAVLICLMAAHFSVQVYVTATTFKAALPPALSELPIPPLTYCLPDGSQRSYLLFNTGSLVFDAVAFCIAAFSLLRLWLTGCHTNLVKTLFVDGLLFFSISLIANVANIVKFVTTDDMGNTALLLPLGTALHGIASTRLVFSLRKAAKRSDESSGSHPAGRVGSRQQSYSSSGRYTSGINRTGSNNGAIPVFRMPSMHHPDAVELQDAGFALKGAEMDIEIGDEKKEMR